MDYTHITALTEELLLNSSPLPSEEPDPNPTLTQTPKHSF